MKKRFVCIFYINSCVIRMRTRPSDSDSNNRAEKCANREKWLAGCFNPISGSGAKSRNYRYLRFPSPFFRALYFRVFFVGILRKFQTLSIVTIYQTLARVKKTNNAIKSITLNDRIVLSARWIPNIVIVEIRSLLSKISSQTNTITPSIV